MSKALTVTYELFPPSGTPVTNLKTSQTHTFAVTSPDASSQAYYQSLRQSITQAKDTLGDELTAWRDAVGNRELKKEPRKVTKDDEEDEEDEEE